MSIYFCGIKFNSRYPAASLSQMAPDITFSIGNNVSISNKITQCTIRYMHSINGCLISEGSRDIHSWRFEEAKTEIKRPLDPGFAPTSTLTFRDWSLLRSTPEEKTSCCSASACIVHCKQLPVTSTFYINENGPNVLIFEMWITYQFWGSGVAANDTSTRPGGSQD